MPAALRCNRRSLLKAGAGALALAFVPRALARMPLLTETEPDAVALNYVEDVARIKAAGVPEFRVGSRCAGCYFYQGDGDSEPCTVFSGWRVNSNGWCRQFAPRP